jgi:hypothetical protein
MLLKVALGVSKSFDDTRGNLANAYYPELAFFVTQLFVSKLTHHNIFSHARLCFAFISNTPCLARKRFVDPLSLLLDPIANEEGTRTRTAVIASTCPQYLPTRQLFDTSESVSKNSCILLPKATLAEVAARNSS